MPKVLTTDEIQMLQNEHSGKLELTLVKTKTYNLKPFGKFAIKFKTRQRNNPNVIPFDELEIYQDTAYPMTEEQEKQVVNLMKKHKTDILADGSYFGFYTRTNEGLTMVRHPKLILYNTNETFRNTVDEGYSFGKK